MTIEDYQKLKENVLAMAVEPPWCENVECLKKWVDGFETCQGQIICIIDAKIKALSEE